jgi:predicted MFS family arabinose efflux permease
LTDPLDAYRGLRHPFVRRFAIGRFSAVAGYQIISVAVGWELYERTGDALALGLVGLAEVAPVILLMIASGHAADRYPRRTVAIAAHVVLVGAAAGLALVSRFEGPTPLIYLLLVVVGIGRAFSGPSVSTILPQLLTPRDFANVNAWLASAHQIASISGPALGGMAIAVAGRAAPAYALAAIGQAVFVAMLLTLPRRPPPVAQDQRSAGDIFAGLRFVRRNRIFLAAITLDLFAVLFGGAVALLPMFAKDILHVGPDGLGWLRAAPGAGAFVMALVTTRLSPWRRPGRVLLGAVAGFGAATVAFGWSTSVAVSLVCLFLTGVFDNVSVVIRLTLEQVITPDALRGRVSAVKSVFLSMSNELGAFESGVAAALIGPVLAVVAGGVITLGIVGLVAWRWPELARIGPLHALRPVEENEA